MYALPTYPSDLWPSPPRARTNKPRLKAVLRRAEALGCVDAVEKGTTRLKQLDVMGDLEDAIAEEDMDAISSAHLGGFHGVTDPGSLPTSRRPEYSVAPYAQKSEQSTF